jgi:hypothetical protein
MKAKDRIEEGWVGVIGTKPSLERVLADSTPWWCLPKAAVIGAFVAMYCTSTASTRGQGIFALYSLTGFESEHDEQCRRYGSTARIFGYPAFARLALQKSLDQPLTWREMRLDPVLSSAQCVQRRFQGTFFRLRPVEVRRILTLAKGQRKA